MVGAGRGWGDIASGQGSPGWGARSRTCPECRDRKKAGAGGGGPRGGRRCSVLGDVEEVGGTRGLKTRAPDGEDRAPVSDVASSRPVFPHTVLLLRKSLGTWRVFAALRGWPRRCLWAEAGVSTHTVSQYWRKAGLSPYLNSFLLNRKGLSVRPPHAKAIRRSGSGWAAVWVFTWLCLLPARASLPRAALPWRAGFGTC